MFSNEQCWTGNKDRDTMRIVTDPLIRRQKTIRILDFTVNYNVIQKYVDKF